MAYFTNISSPKQQLAELADCAKFTFVFIQEMTYKLFIFCVCLSKHIDANDFFHAIKKYLTLQPR